MTSRSVVHVAALVAECAYYKAERRGFRPGSELDDWLAAEQEIASALAGQAPAAPRKAKAKADKAKSERPEKKGGAKK